jgi:hypothetical protein
MAETSRDGGGEDGMEWNREGAEAVARVRELVNGMN